MVAQAAQEYLVSHGNAGEFGRFLTAGPFICRRGDCVVIESARGAELGVVLCESGATHARLLPATAGGRLLRLATPEDEQTAGRMRERGKALFEDSRLLADSLGLELEVLDAEVSLDGRQGTIHYLGRPGVDLNPFAATLAGRHELFLLLQNLAAQAGTTEEPNGCGKPDCGQAGGGKGCTTCGSGGGCATGCGSGPTDISPYFAHLRAQMEKRNLMPLL